MRTPVTLESAWERRFLRLGCSAAAIVVWRPPHSGAPISFRLAGRPVELELALTLVWVERPKLNTHTG